jgi:hypothetical protein
LFHCRAVCLWECRSCPQDGRGWTRRQPFIARGAMVRLRQAIGG